MSTEAEAGWSRLEEALAVSLQQYRDKEMLILERRGGGRYLQVHANGDGSFHTEVSANQFLAAENQLDWPELEVLKELGWMPPQAGGSPNHNQAVSPSAAASRLAKLAIATLERALGMAGPGALQYRAFNSAGGQITLPLLAQAGIASVDDAAVAALRCPRCGGTDVDHASKETVLARRSSDELPVPVAPPHACRRDHCQALFFADGRYLAQSGARTSNVMGWTQIIAIDARDLERAELGPDGVLCLAYLGGHAERFLSVRAEDVPKATLLLKSRMSGAEEDDALALRGESDVVLRLVRQAFAQQIVTDRDGFSALLGEAGIACESYSWP